MSRKRPRERAAFGRAAFSAVVLLVLGIAGVVGLRAPRTQKPAPARAAALSTASVAPQLPAAAALVSAPAAPAEATHEADGHPHPITPEHQRIQRENQLIGALNDAMDLHDVAAMRRLITLYRELDPSDEHRLQEGYERIADCLQEPGEASRARAQQYYDEERASTLRRYVRRACFE